MAFVLPTFNLTCNIFTNGLGWGPLRLSSPCNLAYSKRVNQMVSEGFFPVNAALLLPALTDIRGPLNASGFDGVECPAGSGRWYIVSGVEDIGKGFANEHRCATLRPSGGPGGVLWPTPIP